jgi:tetratricopeptide (TPR) repeat protein
VENDPAIQEAQSNVILMMVDAEKGEGPELAKRFGIVGYPTFVVVNGAGAESDRWIGYDSAAEWVGLVDEARNDPRSIADKKVAFAEQPTLALARSLARQTRASGEFVEAVRYLEAASRLDTDPQAKARYELAKFQAMSRGIKSGAYTGAEVKAQADRVIDQPDIDGKTLLEVAYDMGRVARQTEDMTLYTPYLKVAFTASDGTSDEDAQKYRDYLKADYLLFVEQDPDAAVAAKKARLGEGWKQDPKQLNSFAWWCFENRVNLEEAQELALEGVRLATDDAQRANILDTAAEICNARGDCTKAVELIREAVELNPASDYLREQLVRFEALAAERG